MAEQLWETNDGKPPKKKAKDDGSQMPRGKEGEEHSAPDRIKQLKGVKKRRADILKELDNS